MVKELMGRPGASVALEAKERDKAEAKGRQK
jgi:hypothetical protein